MRITKGIDSKEVTIVQPNQPLSARRPFNDNRTVE